jgi:DNA-directed RNA polymerase specialized sigma24 family protein
LRGGDLEAAQPLWERYFARLVRVARIRLRTKSCSTAAEDEEDAALSAFDSFCRAVTNDRFPQLDDRGDLWRILVALTERKVADQRRRARRLKRGGSRVSAGADVSASGFDDGRAGLIGIASRAPAPQFAVEFAEQCRCLLEVLHDAELRQVAVWRLEGHTVDEIAARLGCARRTVARRLELIRTLWRARFSDGGDAENPGSHCRGLT